MVETTPATAPAVHTPCVTHVYNFLESLPADTVFNLWDAENCFGAQLMRYLNPTATAVLHQWDGGEITFSPHPENPLSSCEWRGYDFEDAAVAEFMYEVSGLATWPADRTSLSIIKALADDML